MRRFVLLALLAVAALATGGTPASAADQGATSDSLHYHLVSTGTQAEAEEWTRVLESAWPQYAEFFGKQVVLRRSTECFATPAVSGRNR